RAAPDGGGLEAVGRTVIADPIAALGNVAVAGGGAALSGALRVGWAGGAAAGAVLRWVAGAGGRAALDGGGLEAVGGTVIADPIAALGNVAVARGGGALRRARPVRWGRVGG